MNNNLIFIYFVHVLWDTNWASLESTKCDLIYLYMVKWLLFSVSCDLYLVKYLFPLKNLKKFIFLTPQKLIFIGSLHSFLPISPHSSNTLALVTTILSTVCNSSVFLMPYVCKIIQYLSFFLTFHWA